MAPTSCNARNKHCRKEHFRVAAATASPSSYGHTFASISTALSIASILVIALICHCRTTYMIDLERTLFGDVRDEEQAGQLIDGIVDRQRRLQQNNANESSHQDDSSLPSLPCEDIFKSVPPSNSSALLGDGVSTDNYLCRYAQQCDGDWPSVILLPLILCHGLHFQENVNNSSQAGAYNYTDTGFSYNYSHSNDFSTNNRRSNMFQTSLFIHFILPPLILCYLYLLFRLLATTADSYFSPALETFSFEMGLPPRFAGATLLALGNGSPDLGSTINAILLWNEPTTINTSPRNKHKHTAEGWTMSLGSLAGGGMFVGTIVSGLILQSCNSIPCRGAFLRDVSMYALSICMVWNILESQSVTRRDVYVLLGLWVGYVTIVLGADVYHRKVTLPRLHAEGKKRRESIKAEKVKRLSALAAGILNNEQNNVDVGVNVDETVPFANSAVASYGRETGDANSNLESLSTDNDTNQLSKSHPRLSVRDRFAMLMSNYDPASVKLFDSSSRSSTVSNDDSESTTIQNIMNQIHSIRRTSIAFPIEGVQTDILYGSIQTDALEDEMPGVTRRLDSFPEELEEESTIDKVDKGSCSKCAIFEVYDEILYRARCYWENSFVNESSWFEKFGVLLELPITGIRTMTIPVPCEDHYNRVIVALSTAISPIWIIWYFESDFNLHVVMFSVTAVLVAVAVLRFGGDEKLPLVAAAPLSLYGFFIATTWIDVIGNNLVGLLQFLGTICRIPAPILGVTVLAWGNSLGDLSANVAMARKGCPDMATTANFAGPSFNLLVGVGCGFLSLQNKIHSASVYPVYLTRSIRIGFSFNIVNCVLIIICAAFCQGRLPYGYSYVFFVLYVLFIAMSLMTLIDVGILGVES